MKYNILALIVGSLMLVLTKQLFDVLQQYYFVPVTTAASTGLLKVKIFSRMKEKNIVTSPKDSGKDADENFDLVPTTPTASTTIFEKSGMKLKISTPTSAAFQMASPVSAVSTLASPTVTITPAVPNSQSLLLDKSKTPPGGFIR